MKFNIEIMCSGDSIYQEHFDKEIRPIIGKNNVVAHSKIDPSLLFQKIRELIVKENVLYYEIGKTFFENGKVKSTKIIIDGESCESKKENSNKLNEENNRLEKLARYYEDKLESTLRENFWLKQSIEAENDRLTRNDSLEKENIELKKQIKELEEDKFFIVNGHKKALANLEKEKHILKITNDIFFDQIIELKARIDELEKQLC